MLADYSLEYLGDFWESVRLYEEMPMFYGFHHVVWYTSNGKQAAHYFVTAMGFQYSAHKGLETHGSVMNVAHCVVQNGDIIIDFVSPLRDASLEPNDSELQQVQQFLTRHGDGVKDVAFKVKDVDFVYSQAVSRGARGVKKPTTVCDANGQVRIATIEALDGIQHTIVDTTYFNGRFLPGFAHTSNRHYVTRELPNLVKIDHCVQNRDWDAMLKGCDWYAKLFGFKKFWSVDETVVSTPYSALHSTVMTCENELVKMPINEPAKGLMKSQIEEFIEFNNGGGIQHLAFESTDIIKDVTLMRDAGVEFISVPPSYYENVSQRLKQCGVVLKEDLHKLQELGILIDFDTTGRYLLQLFTKNLTPRPTIFIEIIQRHQHNGFGAGNFKALFETIEQEQRARGTLTLQSK